MTKKAARMAIAATAIAVAALAAFLVLTALNRSISYFYTPTDLAALPAPPTGPVRLGGLVAAGSVQFADGEDATVDFTVEDGGATRAVSYRGVLPDLFREGQGVVVLGRLDADGRLVASEVLAKHDETYMPREVADALKKQGVWREPAKP
jgi:cytochrome c-type biogenesis protein CcmE